MPKSSEPKEPSVPNLFAPHLATVDQVMAHLETLSPSMEFSDAEGNPVSESDARIQITAALAAVPTNAEGGE